IFTDMRPRAANGPSESRPPSISAAASELAITHTGQTTITVLEFRDCSDLRLDWMGGSPSGRGCLPTASNAAGRPACIFPREYSRERFFVDVRIGQSTTWPLESLPSSVFSFLGVACLYS